MCVIYVIFTHLKLWVAVAGRASETQFKLYNLALLRSIVFKKIIGIERVEMRSNIMYLFRSLWQCISLYNQGNTYS